MLVKILKGLGFLAFAALMLFPLWLFWPADAKAEEIYVMGNEAVQTQQVTDLNGVEWSSIQAVINTDWVKPENSSLSDGTTLSVSSDGHTLTSDNGVDSRTHRFNGRILKIAVSSVNDKHVLIIHENGSAELVVQDGVLTIQSESDGVVVLDVSSGCATVYSPPTESGIYEPLVDGYVVAQGTNFAHNGNCTSEISFNRINTEYEAVDRLYREQRISTEATPESTPVPTAEATKSP